MDQVSETEDLRGFDGYTVTLGDRLRGERATLGKSLEDIQEEIKLRVEILQGIEDSDLTAFPSPSFVAGYVRSYANHLDLDSEECFQLFCEESGFVGLQSEINGTKGQKRKKAVKSTNNIDDPILNPRIPHKPINSGLFSNVSPSGILSLFVLLGLIVGLGYGGMAVLKEVQRVQFAPVNETPSVVQTVSTLSAPNGAGGAPQEDTIASIQNSDLEEFYRPTELSVPRLTPRDGPISGIDSSSFGIFAQTKVPVQIELPEILPPQVTEVGPPSVDVVALRPAWVRVFNPNGDILFEKILDSGQRYRVPEAAKTAMMRAGNSGSVYIMVGEQMYGPVGKATGVARKVSLDATLVPETYDLVENALDQPLAPPVNADLTAQAVQ
jgi:cytoskeletal protein RodZ